VDPYRAKFNGSFVSSLALQVAEYIKTAYLDFNAFFPGNNTIYNVSEELELDIEDYKMEHYEIISHYALLLVQEFGNATRQSDLGNEIYSGSESQYNDQYEDQRDAYVSDLMFDIVLHIHETVGSKIVTVMDILNVNDNRILYEIHAK
jgi:hypothetical protein